LSDTETSGDGTFVLLRQICWGTVEWIPLALNMDKWRAVVTTVMIFQLPYNEQNFFTSLEMWYMHPPHQKKNTLLYEVIKIS